MRTESYRDFMYRNMDVFKDKVSMGLLKPSHSGIFKCCRKRYDGVTIALTGLI